MNISLPSALKAFVDGQVASGQYATASEYVRDLIRQQAKAEAQARLETLLLDGMQREATEWTDADADSLMRLAATGQ